MIIPDEKSYAQCLLESGFFQPGRIKKDIYIASKYLYHQQNLSLEETLHYIYHFAQTKSTLTKQEANRCLSYIQQKLPGSKLKSPKHIFFTKEEINRIKKLEDKNLQKLMFCLWTLAKIQMLQNKSTSKTTPYASSPSSNQLYFFDSSKHQRDIFSLSALDHLRISKRMDLLRTLVVKEYIGIKTISNNAKMIFIQNSCAKENVEGTTSTSFTIVPELYPLQEKTFSYYQFIHIWDEFILQNPKHYCKVCKNSFKKKNNRQVYCSSCKKFMEKIWDRQNKKKRVLEDR